MLDYKMCNAKQQGFSIEHGLHVLVIWGEFSMHFDAGVSVVPTVETF